MTWLVQEVHITPFMVYQEQTADIWQICIYTYEKHREKHETVVLKKHGEKSGTFVS